MEVEAAASVRGMEDGLEEEDGSRSHWLYLGGRDYRPSLWSFDMEGGNFEQEARGI